MIHQVLVIDRSGICLFNHEFSTANIDSNLFSGFVMALNNFSQEMTKKQQNIESIQLTRWQYIISPFRDFLLIIIANKYDMIDTFDELILELENLFLEKFGHLEEKARNNLDRFEPFHEVVEKLCITYLNIGFIGRQSESKKQIWSLFEHLGEKESAQKNQQDNWNIIQMNLKEIGNTNITIWNMDLEKNIDLFSQLLEDKRLVFFIIEPSLQIIKQFIPKIQKLKAKNDEVGLFGIILKNTGKVSKENCEIILNIPILEIDLTDSGARDQLREFMIQTIKGE